MLIGFQVNRWEIFWCVKHETRIQIYICSTLKKKKKLKPKNIFYLFQDKVEEADGGRTRASGRSWKLLRPAEDVPVPVLLPAEPGVQPGPRSCPLSVQRPIGAPAGPAETPGSSDPAPRPAGGQRAATSSASPASYERRASPASSAAVSGPLQILFFLIFIIIFFFGFSFADPGSLGLVRINETKTERVLKKQTPKKTKTKTNCSAFKW